MALFEQVFLIQRLPAWHSNRLSRLIKAPKLHVGVEVQLSGSEDGAPEEPILFRLEIARR